MKWAMRWATTVATVGCLVSNPACRGVEPLVSRHGVGTLIHPIQVPDKVPQPNPFNGQQCRYCKEHCHIFAVNGLNPLCLGNFNGLCGYLKDQGFTHTHFGQLYTSHYFAQQIQEVRAADPEARIVLIGFSLGANYVKSIANHLDKDGIKVDLLVYLVGDHVNNSPSSRPKNVARVVNVRAKGLVLTGGDVLFNGEDLDGAKNVKLECRHILVPSRKETLEMLMAELLTTCCEPVGPAPVITPALPVAAPATIRPPQPRSPYGG